MRALFKLFALFSSILWISAVVFAGPKEGAEFRIFLAEIVTASAMNDPAARAGAFRETFANHAPLASEMSDEKKFDALLKDADLDSTTEVVLGDGEKNRIRAMRDNILRQTNDWPEVNSQKSKFPYVKKLFSNHKEDLIALANSPLAERQAYLQQVPDSAFTALGNSTKNGIKEIDISRSHILQLIVKDLKNIQINGLTPLETEQLGQLFLRYYKDLAPADKERIVISWLRLPPRTPMERQLGEVLQHSGPVMQKLFQLVGRDASSPELRATMSELLSNIRAFPTAEAKEIVTAELGRPLPTVFSSFSEQPLAAGTIGQVHAAKLKSGNPVVVKVLRPKVREQMLEEFKVLENAAGGDVVFRELISRLRQSFLAETDLGLERANLKQLKAYTSPKRGIYVPNAEPLAEKSNRMIIMERAPGQTLANLRDLDPRIKGAALYNALYQWFDEALFGSGFFHGDMHLGNMLFELHENARPKYRLTIIDPGNANRLTLEQRKNFLRLVYAVLEKNPDNAIASIATLSNSGTIQNEKLHKEVAELLKLNKSAMETASDVMFAAIRNGIQLDSRVIQFSRAHLLITKEIHRNNAEIHRLYPGAKLIKPNNVYIRSALRHAGVDIPRRLLGQESEAVIETEPLRRLAITRLKALYGRIVANCAKLFSRL